MWKRWIDFKAAFAGIVLGLVMILVAGTGQASEESVWQQGLALMSAGDYKTALSRFQEVLAADPNHAQARTQIACCHIRLQEFTEAKEVCDQAIQINPRDPIAYLLRGHSRLRRKQYQLALEDYNRAIDLSPKQASFHRERASAYAGLEDSPRAEADRTTAFLLDLGNPVELQEEHLVNRLREQLQRPESQTIRVVICVPQWEEVSPTTVHIVIDSSGARQYLCSRVSSEINWQNLTDLLLSISSQLSGAVDFDPHSTPFFESSRGLSLTFQLDSERDIQVAPGRTVRLSREVLSHFEITSESNAPHGRTALIITEAHDQIDGQLSAYQGLQSLLKANPWLLEPDQSAFLVEAWEANTPLSVEPLVQAQPAPSEELVQDALGSFLIPSYVAVGWLNHGRIPLIGHEDPVLYRFCNYLHMATATRVWTGNDLVEAEALMGMSVVARNQSSGQTFVKALEKFPCPILFIGHGHIGPYTWDNDGIKTQQADARQRAKTMERLVPGYPTEWLATVDRRSVTSYLKDNDIGFIQLTPRWSPLVDDFARAQARLNYLLLRRIQHERGGEPVQSRLNDVDVQARDCTTMPDPGNLAKMLPALERLGLPHAEQFSPGTSRARLANLLSECGNLLGCFPGDTLVQTPTGPQAIQDLQPGDLVLGCDTKTSTWGVHPVESVLHQDYAGDFIILGGGTESITATGNHPFWIHGGNSPDVRPHASHVGTTDTCTAPTGRWVNARDLRPGDRVSSGIGKSLVIDSVAVSADRRRVFTLRVANVHTFAVGLSGLLVHNNCSWVPARLFRDPAFDKRLEAHHRKLSPGFRAPGQCAAHHLIPVAEAQQSELMKAAARAGYNVNRPQNGMYLPTTEAAAVAMKLPLHRGSHQAYSDYVADKLQRLDADFAKSQQSGRPWNRDQIMRKINQLETHLRQQLQRNKFDLQD